MKQEIAVTALVLAAALTGCGQGKVAVQEIAAQLGTGSDDVSRWIAKNADAAGTTVDDTATTWRSRIATTPRATGIPRTFATETACGALSDILFTDRADDPPTVSGVLADVVEAMGSANGTSFETYLSLKTEVEGINQQMNDGEPVYLDLILLRQTYCPVVLKR